MKENISFWLKVRSILYKHIWCGYIFKILIWIDQGVNVVFAPFFNALLLIELSLRGIVKSRAARFGFPDETLSSVFGKNKGISHWNKAIAWVLDKIDRGHTDDALEPDEGRKFK